MAVVRFVSGCTSAAPKRGGTTRTRRTWRTAFTLRPPLASRLPNRSGRVFAHVPATSSGVGACHVGSAGCAGESQRDSQSLRAQPRAPTASKAPARTPCPREAPCPRDVGSSAPRSPDQLNSAGSVLRPCPHSLVAPSSGVADCHVGGSRLCRREPERFSVTSCTSCATPAPDSKASSAVRARRQTGWDNKGHRIRRRCAIESQTAVKSESERRTAGSARELDGAQTNARPLAEGQVQSSPAHTETQTSVAVWSGGPMNQSLIRREAR